jgi:hypothetical protein
MCTNDSVTHDERLFPAWEVMLMRACIYGFVTVGLVGIFLESVAYGAAYAAFLAVAAVVHLKWFCCHCPNPWMHDVCISAPPRLMRSLMKHRPGPLSMAEKLVVFSTMAGAMLIPQFWLVRRPMLMALYWAFCLPTFFVFPLHLCKRCQSEHCPFNKGRSMDGD